MANILLSSPAVYKQTAGKYIFRTLGHESNLGAVPQQFVQNASQDVLVITSGNVGLGTGSPRSRLDVVGTGIFSQNIGIGTTMATVSFEVWHSNAMLLPRGSTSARPDGPLQGYMRYNTDTNVFEGFGAGDVWGSLGGVKSTDQLTFISAEDFAGANDANIRFFTGGVQQALLDPQGNLGIGTAVPREKLHVEGNIYANGTVIASNMQIIGDFVTMNTVTSNTEQIVVSNDGTGPAIKITQTGANSIAEFYDDGALALIVADGGRVGINTHEPVVSLDIRTTDAVLLPRGSTEQRPQEVQQGYIRYNTETFQFEGLGAADQWGSLGGVKSTDQYTFISAEEFAGANDSNLRFVTGGEQRMIIDAVGNMGIGTVAARTKLDVVGPVRITQMQGGEGGDGNAIAEFYSSNEVLVVGVAENGFVGIGTQVPVAKLHVVGESVFDGRVGMNTNIPRNDLDLVGTAIVSQNIGIGTTMTSVSFEIWHSNAMLLPRGSTSARPDGPLKGYMRYNTDINVFEGFGAGDVWGSLGGVKSTDQLTYISAEESVGANDANLRFFTGGVQQVLLDPQGNVGIGTAVPREKLHVEGNIYANGTIIASNMQIIGDFVTFNTVTSNTEQIVVSNDGSGPAIKVTQTGANSIAEFYDDGALALIVADGGRVGISTGSPVVSLDIRTTDAVLLPRGTTEQRPQEVQQGYIRYNTETFQFEGLGGANQWGSLGGVKSTDQYTFISAEEYAGANDSNLRFVTGGAQRMIIDAAGNVGVGVSEPGYKLHVDGGIYADTILTSNLNVLGNLFTNFDSTIFRNRLQLAPLNTTIVIGENDNSNLDVQLVSEGLYKFLPNTTDVLLNGLKLAYMNSSSNDYTVSYELYDSYTLINIHLNDQVQPGDVVNITAWPQYLENTNIMQPGYSVQQISYVTMDDSVLIDRTITKPLQVAPYRFVEHITSESAALALLQWTVSGRYIFSKNFCDVYLNGVKLINVAGTGIQDFDITYDYYFEQTRITFTLAHPLSLGDVLDVTIWPEYTDASSNIKGIFYQNYSYFSRVGVTSNIAFTEGNLGIGTTMPLKKLHIEDDIIFDGVMFNKVGQAIWMPGSALEWKTSAGEHPILTPSQSVSINITSKKGQFKYLGNNITYNVFFEASLTGKTIVDGDYVLALQYLADMNSYAVGAVLGELWLTVTTATSITTYKAYAKVLSGGAGVALRYLNGTYEESLATLNIGSSIRLEGTLEYRTGYIADEVSLPKIWTPKGFSENIAGYVGLNNMAVPARARLDIVETAASNLPVLILDQRGSGPLLEMRSNMDDVKLIVDLQGNVGIGTSVARTKLEVSGHIWPSSNLAYDLGSSNLRWRDLYLSGNTIDLGGTYLKRDEQGGGIKIQSESGLPVDTNVRNLNASGYVDINGTVLQRHVTGPLMVMKSDGQMESGMFKHMYVDGTVRASNLEIIGDFVRLNTVTSNTEQMVIENAGTGPALKVTQTGANSIAEFYDDGNVLALKIADGGNVGIGTSNPMEKLDVVGNARVLGALNVSGQINAGSGFLQSISGNRSINLVGTDAVMSIIRYSTGGHPAIEFKKYDVTATTLESWWDMYATETDELRLRRRTGATLEDVMIMNSLGNVGIGTSAPLQKLHVVGAIKATTSINSDTQFLGQASDSASAPSFSFIDDTNTGVFRPAADNVGISCGGIERVRIGDGGNVGIGVASAGERLQVQGNLRVGGSSTENYIAFHGTTGDSPGSFNHGYIGERIHAETESSEMVLFKGNDPATSGPDRIRHIASEHRFDTYTSAVSGTFSQVATAAANTTRMVITNDGYILKPNNVYCQVGKNNGDIPVETFIVFNHVIIDNRGIYNTSNGRFTAPVAGNYMFCFTGMGAYNSPYPNTRWYKNGAETGYGAAHMNNQNVTSVHNAISTQVIIYLNAGDYVQHRCISSAIYGTSSIHCHQMCTLLG